MINEENMPCDVTMFWRMYVVSMVLRNTLFQCHEMKKWQYLSILLLKKNAILIVVNYSGVLMAIIIEGKYTILKRKYVMKILLWYEMKRREYDMKWYEEGVWNEKY